MKNIRTGIGYDIHQFANNRKLYLGGILIPYKKGLLGHSDADVVLHSICDSMLGALGLGDIGRHFPNTDVKYKNISSKLLLKRVYSLCTGKKYKISNIDVCIIAREPKLSPYYNKMKQAISGIVHNPNINIKCTTNENIDGLGQGKGIACYSVVLMYN